MPPCKNCSGVTRACLYSRLHLLVCGLIPALLLLLLACLCNTNTVPGVPALLLLLLACLCSTNTVPGVPTLLLIHTNNVNVLVLACTPSCICGLTTSLFLQRQRHGAVDKKAAEQERRDDVLAALARDRSARMKAVSTATRVSSRATYRDLGDFHAVP